MRIYQITEITYFRNDLQERYELATGLLDEVAEQFHDWMYCHVEQFGGMEAWKEEYAGETAERVELFISDPQSWVDKYGDNEAEIYSDWTLNCIYSNENLILKGE